MKNVSRKLAAALCALSALSLTACSSAPTVKFDTPSPWHDGQASYEKLDYDVYVFDMLNNAAVIADGKLSLTLDEHDDGKTQLDTDFKVTYNAAAPDRDKGKTDTINSTLLFHTESLASASMKKEVKLAPRENTEDLSYTVTADYFGTHVATRTMGGDTSTLTIPGGSFYDNEMMLYLARATAIANDTTTSFYMTNIFDSFILGEFESRHMVASGDKSSAVVQLGGFLGDHIISDEPVEHGPDTKFDVACCCVGIMVNVTNHGPAYYVYYAEQNFKDGEKVHKKVPVKIMYSEYAGSTLARRTEYILSGMSFNK